MQVAATSLELTSFPALRLSLLQIDAAARAASQQHVLLVQSSGTEQAVQLEPSAAASAANSSAVVSGGWHMLRQATAQDWDVGGVWGLGTARTVQEFEQQAGMSFAQITLEPRASYGGQTKEFFAE